MVLFDNLQRLFAEKAREKGLELSVTLRGVPEYLIGDPTSVNQILYNLVGNALKFTHSGKVDIEVAGLNRENNHCWLDIQVRDTGIGIAEEQKEKIFDQFHQVNVFSPNIRGTGLLPAVWWI